MSIFRTLTIIVDRANYGRLFPLIESLNTDSRFNNKVCFTGTILLPRNRELFNSLLSEDQIKPDYCIPVENDYNDYASMAETVSKTISEISKLLLEEHPDLVFIIGDRYEAFGCAAAASLSHIKIAHIQGGELSGTIDESLRHAITKLSHLHFPSTHQAAKNIVQMGEPKANVYPVGCPMADYLFNLTSNSYKDKTNNFILSCIHPVTTNLEESINLIKLLHLFYSAINKKVIWILPNNDPGSREIMDTLNNLEASYELELVSNISPKKYYKLMSSSLMAVGNSSSYVRDSSMLATPVILLGSRQNNREISNNVIFLENPSIGTILDAYHKHLSLLPYQKSFLYGHPGACQLILDHSYDFLSTFPSTQKSSKFNE